MEKQKEKREKKRNCKLGLLLDNKITTTLLEAI